MTSERSVGRRAGLRHCQVAVANDLPLFDHTIRGAQQFGLTVASGEPPRFASGDDF